MGKVPVTVGIYLMSVGRKYPDKFSGKIITGHLKFAPTKKSSLISLDEINIFDMRTSIFHH